MWIEQLQQPSATDKNPHPEFANRSQLIRVSSQENILKWSRAMALTVADELCRLDLYPGDDKPVPGCENRHHQAP